jgi:hypothetical protein
MHVTTGFVDAGGQFVLSWVYLREYFEIRKGFPEIIRGPGEDDSCKNLKLKIS